MVPVYGYRSYFIIEEGGTSVIETERRIEEEMSRCFCILFFVSKCLSMASRGNTWRGVCYISSFLFSPFSRHATFLFVDFVGDLYVPPNYFEEHPVHVLACKLAPLAMK